MKKRNIAAACAIPRLLAAVLFMAALLPAGLAYGAEASVEIEGRRVEFPGGGPVIVDGSTLVPVRGVFEALGFAVGWDEATGTVTLMGPGKVVVITIGSDAFTMNGALHRLDVPAQIIGASTMLPIRAVLESVGYIVDWDAATRTVIISAPEPPPEPEPPPAPLPLTPDELRAMIAEAPHYTQTHRARPHPSRPMTEAELEAWVAEYHQMGGMNNVELELLLLVNDIRARHGLPPFILCPRLSKAARLFSQLQVAYHTTGHVDRYYGSASDRMALFGVEYRRWKENANSEMIRTWPDGRREYVYLTPQEMIDQYMESPGHRAHILTEDTTHVGFGFDRGENNRGVPTMKSIMPRGA